MKAKNINWALLLGMLILFVIGLVAVFGQEMAPQDPLERTRVIQSEEGWEIPPYAPSTPGFPLGSDDFGRDILSRLLWAVRPTMVLVIVVAAVRLALGILIGIFSGWFDNGFSRLLEFMIAAVLVIPSLIAALIIVSNASTSLEGVYSERMGIFIVGLSIIGWAEAAQIVRAQIRTTKSQEFVEAARALGASGGQILRLHIARHIMPLVWILFAFEVGSALMVTSGLGFLGYFIGGIQKLPGEYAAAGYPELGEMLASTKNIILEPWGMVTAAGAVFVTVLGFNLVGQGLQMRLSLRNMSRRTVFTRMSSSISQWIEEKITYPLSVWYDGKARRSIQAFLLAMAVITLGYGWSRYQEQIGQQITDVQIVMATLVLPDDSLPTPMATVSPQTAEALWSYETSAGLLVPPVIGPGGEVYLFSSDNMASALNPDGSMRWQQTLDPPLYSDTVFEGRSLALSPVLAPDGTLLIVSQKRVHALDEQGSISWEYVIDAEPEVKFCCQWDSDHSTFYLLDQQAGLYAFSPGTGLRWKATPSSELRPVSAPFIAPDGNIYYSVGETGVGGYVSETDIFLQAVTPQGEPRWISRVPVDIAFVGHSWVHDFAWLRSDPTGGLIFLAGNIYNAADGKLLDISLDWIIEEAELPFRNPRFYRYFTGLDARTYLVSEELVVDWLLKETEFDIVRYKTYKDIMAFNSLRQANANNNHIVWLLYDDFFEIGEKLLDPTAQDRQIIWVDLENDRLRHALIPQGEHLVAMDEQTATFYVCRALRNQNRVECNSLLPWTNTPDWKIIVEGINGIKHATLDLAAGKLYIFSTKNQLSVINLSSP